MVCLSQYVWLKKTQTLTLYIRWNLDTYLYPQKPSPCLQRSTSMKHYMFTCFLGLLVSTGMYHCMFTCSPGLQVSLAWSIICLPVLLVCKCPLAWSIVCLPVLQLHMQNFSHTPWFGTSPPDSNEVLKLEQSLGRLETKSFNAIWDAL